MFKTLYEQTMNSKERVKKAFDHEEPDRVPIFEAEINAPVASEILGRPACVGYGGYTRVKRVAEALLEDHYEAFVRQRTDDYIALYRSLGIDVFHAPPFPITGRSPKSSMKQPGDTSTVLEGRGQSRAISRKVI